MSKHTSFKIGGPAEFFIKILSIEELQKILEFAKKHSIPTVIATTGFTDKELEKMKKYSESL